MSDIPEIQGILDLKTYNDAQGHMDTIPRMQRNGMAIASLLTGAKMLTKLAFFLI